MSPFLPSMRPLVMRFACMLLTVVLAAGAQSISENEAARARHLLASPQWQDKAWGVYFAGRLHSDELKEPIIEAFREASALRDAKPVTEEYDYLAALFDAAIQTDRKSTRLNSSHLVI